MAGVKLRDDEWQPLFDTPDARDWIFPIEALAFGHQAIQPTPPISMTQAGMCAEAAKTRIRPSTLLMIESRRPVLNDASLM